MRIAIRYFTKSKKGNTKKLADRLSSKLGVEAKEVKEDLNEEVEALFLLNAMYAATIDKEVKTFLKRNKDKIKTLYNVSSSASGSSTLKAVKKVAEKEGISVSDKYYSTVASWLALNKGRPNEEDLARLDKFAEEVTNSSI